MMGCSQELDAGLAIQSIQMGEALALPTAQQMTDVKTNRCWEPMNCPKETFVFQSGEEVRFSMNNT